MEIDIEELVPEDIGGYCGLLSPLIAYGFILIAILIHSWFSLTGNALSDLGETGVAYNNIFNFALIISGLLFVLFIMAMFRRAESEVGIIGLIGIAIGAFFLIMTGIFPKGTSPHMLMAVLFYSASAAGLFIFGLDEFLELEPVWAAFIWSSLGFAAVSSGLVYSLSPGGIAIYEIIGSFPLIQFSLVFGTSLLTD